MEINPENLKAIRDGLWMVVNQAGTGRNALVKGYDVSGKTGTAQVISLEGAKAAKGKTSRNLSDHGWFVFLAPRDNPQIAGVIFAEHGEHGSTAAIVARHALETFFAKKEGRPLPPPPAVPGDPPPIPQRATIRRRPAWRTTPRRASLPGRKPCSNDASTFTSTGPCCWRFWPCAGWASR